MKKSTIVALLAAGMMTSMAATTQAATPTQQAGGSTAIVLQGFHWNSANYAGPDWYNTLLNNVGDISTMGFTHVWFPPPSDSSAKEGYLPRQLNKLDSKYGSAAELTNVVSAFKNKGVKSIVDVVVNHRVGTTGWSDFTNPNWTTYSIVNGDECNCGLGNPDTGQGFSAGRDLDHKNVGEVQNGIVNWLNFTLKPVGFSGLRFDYVKGFGANYVGQYANAFAPDFCVGEMWPDSFDLNNLNANRQAIMDWINGTGSSCGAFDFTTKGILNDALANGNYWRLKATDGKPQGAIGWWPAMSVTFVDNHDTGPAESCGTGQNLWAVRLGAGRLCVHPVASGHPDRVLPAHLQLEPQDADRGADGGAQECRRDVDVGRRHPAGHAGPVRGHRHRHDAPAGDENRPEQLEPRRRLDLADVG